MIIIYNYNGNVATLTPEKAYKDLFSGTDEEKLIYIANAQLPNGTKYEVSPFDAVDMEDRTVGNDWIYKGTGRERTSVALNEADQLTYNNQEQAYVDAL